MDAFRVIFTISDRDCVQVCAETLSEHASRRHCLEGEPDPSNGTSTFVTCTAAGRDGFTPITPSALSTGENVAAETPHVSLAWTVVGTDSPDAVSERCTSAVATTDNSTLRIRSYRGGGDAAPHLER